MQQAVTQKQDETNSIEKKTVKKQEVKVFRTFSGNLGAKKYTENLIKAHCA